MSGPSPVSLPRSVLPVVPGLPSFPTSDIHTNGCCSIDLICCCSPCLSLGVFCIPSSCFCCFSPWVYFIAPACNMLLNSSCRCAYITCQYSAYCLHARSSSACACSSSRASISPAVSQCSCCQVSACSLPTASSISCGGSVRVIRAIRSTSVMTADCNIFR